MLVDSGEDRQFGSCCRIALCHTKGRTHTMTRSTLAGGLAGLALVVATTGSIAHAQSVNQNGQGQNQNNQPRLPPLSATPELDSSLLFGAGLLGLGAASSVARYIRRRHQPDR
jgi:hypothetical protein